MKTKLTLFILLFSITSIHVFSQGNSYISRIDENTCVRITINSHGDKITFKRNKTDNDGAVGQNIINLTDLEATPTENPKIFAIDFGRGNGTYWWIPFNTDEPPMVQNGGPYYYECCGSCDIGECDWRNTAGCRTCECPRGYTSSCRVKRSEPGGNNITGGGILVRASRVTEE